MSNQKKTESQAFITGDGLWQTLINDWKFWATGSVISFFFASILMSGWPEGLLPNISYPYVRGGDAAFMDWGVQRLIEGWVFNNPRSGYPFGSNFLDYPGSDAGGFLLLKILGIISGSYYSATNLFFLFSFPTIVIASYATLRALNLNPWLCLSGGLIYAFAPFHFLRIGHLTFTWYFVVPIFFYVAIKLFQLQPKVPTLKGGVKYFCAWLILLMLTASFGVYYALFGTIVIGVGAVAGSISNQSNRNLLIGISAISMVVLGVATNLAPNIANNYFVGKSSEAVTRSLGDAEMYGFKMMQLLLPHPSHRLESLSKVTTKYNSSTPLVNENITSSLGIVGTFGFVIFGYILLCVFAGKKVDQRMSLLTLLGLVLFLFGTIGGLGSLFSSLVSTSIRGWNRISIFISFATVAIFLLAIQTALNKISPIKIRRILIPASAFILIAIALYDQTNWPCKECNLSNLAAFKNESGFIHSIEESLPKGSAIYQLPYMAFPEVPPLYQLNTYEQATAFANSKELRWSYGGMKGRQGDLFFRSLAKDPIYIQIDTAKKLGFSGIYIDRRGYADNGNQTIADISKLLGSPSLVRGDGAIAFFPIEPSESTDISKLSYKQIIEKSGYQPAENHFWYKSKFEDGINFSLDGYPDFLKSVLGIDGKEGWGRWSNATLSPFVIIEFKSPLPKKFILELNAIGFGPNAGVQTTVRVGNIEEKIILLPNNKVFKLELNHSGSNTIEIIPPKPTPPSELNTSSSDLRKIGIGLISLKIKPIN
jgi:phosphoglycerol transferase